MAKPNRKWIGDTEHVATVFRIESRYEDGTPENLTLIKDDTVVELSEDPSKNHFLVGYVPKLDYSEYAEKKSDA